MTDTDEIVCPYCGVMLSEPDRGQHRHNGTMSYQCLLCGTTWSLEVEVLLQRAAPDLIDVDSSTMCRGSSFAVRKGGDCMLAGDLSDFVKLEVDSGFLVYF